MRLSHLLSFLLILALGACQQVATPLGSNGLGATKESPTATEGSDAPSTIDDSGTFANAGPSPIDAKPDDAAVQTSSAFVARVRYGANFAESFPSVWSGSSVMEVRLGTPSVRLEADGSLSLKLLIEKQGGLANDGEGPWSPAPAGAQVRIVYSQEGNPAAGKTFWDTRVEQTATAGNNVTISASNLGSGEIAVLYLDNPICKRRGGGEAGITCVYEETPDFNPGPPVTTTAETTSLFKQLAFFRLDAPQEILVPENVRNSTPRRPLPILP